MMSRDTQNRSVHKVRRSKRRAIFASHDIVNYTINQVRAKDVLDAVSMPSHFQAGHCEKTNEEEEEKPCLGR